MKSKNKTLASICILLFHLGLLYMVYQQLAPEQPNNTAQPKTELARP